MHILSYQLIFNITLCAGKDNVYIFGLKVKEKADNSARFSVIFLFDMDLFFFQSFVYIFL